MKRQKLHTNASSSYNKCQQHTYNYIIVQSAEIVLLHNGMEGQENTDEERNFFMGQQRLCLH